MRNLLVWLVAWLLAVTVLGCLSGCRVMHDGTGKYVAKLEIGYEVDEHKNAAHAVSEYTVVWPPAPPKANP